MTRLTVFFHDTMHLNEARLLPLQSRQNFFQVKTIHSHSSISTMPHRSQVQPAAPGRVASQRTTSQAFRVRNISNFRPCNATFRNSTSSGFGTSLLPNVTNQPTSGISPQFSSHYPQHLHHRHVRSLNSGKSSYRVLRRYKVNYKCQGCWIAWRNLSAGARKGISIKQPNRHKCSTTTISPRATSVPPISQVSTPQGKDPFADLAGLF